MQTAFSVFVQLFGVLLEIRNQGRTVLQTLRRLPQAVEFQAHMLEVQSLPKRNGQQNQFGVHLGATKTQRFSANLVELSVPAPLWAFMAKHGTHVIQAFAAFIKQVVLNHSAHHTRSGLRAQGELLAV